MSSPPARISAFVLAATGAFAGCGGHGLPDPKVTAAEYAARVEKGDADAVYAMLSTEAQRAHGKEGVRRMVKESQLELTRTARAVAAAGTKVEMQATVRYADGEQASLDVEDGSFRVGSAGALPLGARTPAQALSELRQALARRSYGGVLRVLSSESKSAVENDMKSLVQGLEQPETLDVKITGDRAEVQVPGGHSVKLKREAGFWRIEDFD
ncbi:MAG: hypothetical protein IT375_11220 [Polyangiaceae bacterium]|jgi:hypothetical protein|nr:hypothetical protein [Polyangiaceae bacterium]